MGSPSLIFQDSFSRRENPSGVTTRSAAAIFFFAGRFSAGEQGQNYRDEKKTTPRVVFVKTGQ